MFNSLTAVERLQKKSRKVLNIFTKTIEGLRDVNKRIDLSLVKRDEKIKKLEAERQTLTYNLEENQKVIDKISKMFE